MTRSDHPRQAAAGQQSATAGLLAEALGHHQLRQLAKAEALYEQLLAREPHHVEARHLLGVLHYQTGRHGSAVALIREVIAAQGESARSLTHLALAQQGLGEIEPAAASFARALALDPDYVDASYNFALLQQGRERWAEAAALYERVIALNPQHVEAHTNLGTVRQQQERLAEAIACYERALAIKPDHAAAHNNLGLLLHHAGRISEAQRHLEAAIALEPDNPRGYLNIGEMKRFVAGDPQIAAMEALAARMDSLPDQARLELNFALAKAYMDVGERRRGLQHLLQGNALKRRQISYDAEADIRRLDAARGVFTRALLDAKAGLGDPSPLPVFIVGMPRSGTSLVEQILASHHKVYGAGEIEDFAASLFEVQVPAGAPTGFPEVVPALGAAELRQIATGYLARLRRRAPAAERITDKLPRNFFYVGLIHMVLPGARIIHVRRDPVDTCLSCFSKLFARHQECTYDLAELGRYYKAYARLMEHWRQLLPEGAMLQVQYETLVGDFEAEARRLVAYCGLEWDPACLAFHQTDRPVRTASAAQVRQPIYQSSVGRSAGYEELLQPLIDALR